MSLVHERLAGSLLLFALAAAAWGLVTFARRRPIDGNYWGVLAVGGIVVLAQAVLGVLLLLDDARPQQMVHLLFGAAAVVPLPLYYAASKGRDDRTAALAYAALCLVLAGLLLAARITGG